MPSRAERRGKPRGPYIYGAPSSKNPPTYIPPKNPNGFFKQCDVCEVWRRTLKFKNSPQHKKHAEKNPNFTNPDICIICKHKGAERGELMTPKQIEKEVEKQAKMRAERKATEKVKKETDEKVRLKAEEEAEKKAHLMRRVDILLKREEALLKREEALLKREEALGL
jgi:hypothetical protein